MILSLIFFLCAAGAPLQEKTVYDDFQTPFEVTVPPERIISLAPNVTEILFALGLADRIIGVTRYCDYPAEALQKEKVGGMVDPSLEKIESLRPDLIVAFRGNPLGVLSKLRSLHFPVFVLNLGSSIDGLHETIRKIGRVTGTERAAERLANGLEERLRTVRRALGDTVKRPKVFLSVYGQGLWTCGKGSYLNDLLVRAGGTNIAGTVQRRWLQISRERLIYENPEVIIIMAKEDAAFREAKESFLTDSRLKEIRAIMNGHICWLDENMAGRFGPRLIDALEAVARMLHPEKFEARK